MDRQQYVSSLTYLSYISIKFEASSTYTEEALLLALLLNLFKSKSHEKLYNFIFICVYI